MDRKAELEARIEALYKRIDYLHDMDLFGDGLTAEEKQELEQLTVEYQRLIAERQEEKEAEAKVVTRRVKQAQWRGKNCERQCSKDTGGVVVGRSKAVKVGDRYVQVNCQQPPDCLAPPFFSFECKNTKFPKSVAKAMSQAVANAPSGFIGYVYWYSPEEKVTYIITTKKVFLDMHFSKGG